MLTIWLGYTNSPAAANRGVGVFSNDAMTLTAEVDTSRVRVLAALGGAKKRHAEYISFALSVIRIGPVVSFGSQFSRYSEIVFKGNAEGRYHSLSLFVLTNEFADRFATQFSLGPAFIWGSERRIDFELGYINDKFSAVGVELSKKRS